MLENVSNIRVSLVIGCFIVSLCYCFIVSLSIIANNINHQKTFYIWYIFPISLEELFLLLIFVYHYFIYLIDGPDWLVHLGFFKTYLQ